MKRFWIFFAQMFFAYSMATISMRAVQNINYAGVVVTDLAIAFNGFYLTKRIGQSESKVELAGYMLGGLSGSLVALYLSTHFIRI